MTATADLLNSIDKLRTHAAQFIDESFRLILEGEALGGSVNEDIQQVISLATELGVGVPTLIISDAPACATDLADSAYDDEPWRLIFGSANIKLMIILLNVDFGKSVSPHPDLLPQGGGQGEGEINIVFAASSAG